MKKLVVLLFFLVGVHAISIAQTKIESINLMGKTYTVTKDFPENVKKEIMGKYTYEEKGEPIILLNPDGFGLFQPHMSAPIKIKFWIDCDEKGNIRKEQGVEGRYQYTLLIQYLDGNNGNYPVGEYNLMGVAVLKDLGKAVIYGERYKSLN
ncbi:hypothetical protein N9R54_05325 [Pelobium sp.]|nr:hypothetical protein [Pelobium sp.]MDA9555640.1 hypothetical protein [Pelobium sp.]